MTIFDVPQYSPEWWELRAGVPTASSFDRIITPTGKPSGQRAKYIASLIGDLVDLRPNAFTERGRMGTPEMKAGREAEPAARKWYALETDATVLQVGLVLHESEDFGCSPDGLATVVGENGEADDGVLELKCPLPSTQAEYLMEGVLPGEYRPQCHGHLVVTGRKWCDFMSYCPGLPTLHVRVEADGYTDMLRAALATFLADYHAQLKAFGIDRKARLARTIEKYGLSYRRAA